MERLLTTRPDQEETGILCTHCVDSPVPAAKSCLHCEVSLCDKHLGVHPKSPEHVLCHPTNSYRDRRCSAHREVFRYYCTQDSVCICVSCTVAGEHRGHHVEMLDEASEKKKENLRNVLQILTTQRQETEERVQRLQERRREDQEKAAGVRETVTALFRDIRRQLEELEKRALAEISRQEDHLLLSVSDMIQQLEIQKDELSGKIRDLEELCDTPDPVSVLQEPGEWCHTEDGVRHEQQVHGAGDLDVGLISGAVERGLSDIITGINVQCCVQGLDDISLDVHTASNNIHISDDRKMVTWSERSQARLETYDRFQYYQVMSSGGFSSGRHYWEVDVRGSEYWSVGMCYPSIDRRGDQSLIGNNEKSWCLQREWFNEISARHAGKETPLPVTAPCDRVRVCLDYEAGELSFYSVCDPIRHLHTFSSTFTEPLHAALFVLGGSVMISGGARVGSNLHTDW